MGYIELQDATCNAKTIHDNSTQKLVLCRSFENELVLISLMSSVQNYETTSLELQSQTQVEAAHVYTLYSCSV